MAEAPSDVSCKNNTHVLSISIHNTPKDVAVWPNGRVSIVYIEEILLFNVIGLKLRPGSEGGCYEHIPPDKSGEYNQRNPELANVL